jgi:hypothetical protein
MTSRTSIDLGEVRENETHILVRTTKIESWSDYAKSQLINLNIANAGFLITMIILSASVQSTLKQQQEYNIESQNLLSQVTTSNNNLLLSISQINNDLQTLNDTSIYLKSLYESIISTGSLYNLILMNQTNHLFNAQQNSFDESFNKLNGGFNNLITINTTLNDNVQNLIAINQSISGLVFKTYTMNELTSGNLKIYESTLKTCYMSPTPYSTNNLVINTCISDPHLSIINPSTGPVSMINWFNGVGLKCVTDLCVVSGSVQVQPDSCVSATSQIFVGFNGTGIANVLLPVSLTTDYLAPFTININKYDIAQFFMNFGGLCSLEFIFNYNVLSFG